jgi:Spy/CpxP family protein refolding chaperone
MEKRMIGIVLAMALMLGSGLSATPSLAQGWGGHDEHRMHGQRHHGRHLMRILRNLDLTDEQKTKVREVMMGAHKQAIPMRAELHVAKLELQELLVQDDIDRAAVDQHIDQIGQLQQKLMRHRIDTRLTVHAMLTPEQRGKARTAFMDHLTDGPQHESHRRGGHHREGRHDRQ